MKHEEKDAISIAHRREKHFKESYTLVTFEEGKFKEPIDLRIYATESTTYACLWCHDRRLGYSSGSGKVAGYGFNRGTEAVEEAFKSAGFSGFDTIAGRGDGAITALIADIAEAILKVKHYTITHSHA